MADEPRGGNPPPVPGQEASPQKGSSGRRAGRDRLPKVTPEEFLAVIRSMNPGDSPPAAHAGAAAARENKWGLPHLGEGYGLVARSEGKSPNTIAIVTASVRYLTRYLQDSGASLDIRHIDTAQLRGFVVHLQERTRFAVHPLTPPQEGKLSGHTINAYLRSLRAFWSWACREGLLAQNPFDRMVLPKVPKKVKPTFSDAQLQQLFDAIDPEAPLAPRDVALLLTLLDTGLRVSELTGLRREHVNLENRSFKVWGKGAKERMLPMGQRLQSALWKYIELHRPEPALPRHDFLFLTADGRPLTKNRVENLLKACGQRAGIKDIPVTPHVFRHSMAIRFLRNGGDVFALQRILGHESLDTVKIYLYMAESDVSRAHEKGSPADNLDLRLPAAYTGQPGSQRSRKGKPGRPPT